MTTIVHTLANGPLSTIELSNEPATATFWDALASCTRLRTLVLRTLTIPSDQFLSFWRVCFQVESLFLPTAIINCDGHATQSWFFKRSARLKHIVLENDFTLKRNYEYELRWAINSSRPWLCTPFLESFHCTGDVRIEDMSGLVEEIEYATKAAAGGRELYLNGGLAQGALSVKEDDCDHRRFRTPEDPIDTEQFRGLIPGKRIREFHCPLPNLTSGALAKLISNMDALEKF
ncbi:hypothetical protein BGZ82_005695 [Podila clonocystis]|nr:hypothetical protein BGZ82_005695 [Podila clonocystis]